MTELSWAPWLLLHGAFLSVGLYLEAVRVHDRILNSRNILKVQVIKLILQLRKSNFKNEITELGVVAHAYNSSTWKPI